MPSITWDVSGWAVMVVLLAHCYLTSFAATIPMDTKPPSSSRPYPTYNNRPPYNSGKADEKPFDLLIKFDMPPNGLPPTQFKLENLNELVPKPMNGAYGNSPVPSSQLVVIKVDNPNKPTNPIPSDIFKAGLPAGALVAGDKGIPCRNFISKKCNDLCDNSFESCDLVCDRRFQCTASCRNIQKTCSQICNLTRTDSLSKLPPSADIYLPKCLRNCAGDVQCTRRCHTLCHSVLDNNSRPSTGANPLTAPSNLLTQLPSALGNPAVPNRIPLSLVRDAIDAQSILADDESNSEIEE